MPRHLLFGGRGVLQLTDYCYLKKRLQKILFDQLSCKFESIGGVTLLRPPVGISLITICIGTMCMLNSSQYLSGKEHRARGNSLFFLHDLKIAQK